MTSVKSTGKILSFGPLALLYFLSISELDTNFENYFEIFNKRLTKRMLNIEKNFNNHEKQYFTRSKMKINFFKHFSEDDEVDKENENVVNMELAKTDLSKEQAEMQVSFRTLQYYKKLKQRDKCINLKP